MRYELPDKCPICREKLHAIRLGCDNCGSFLEGNFELDRLTQLPKDMRQFIIIFLKCRGNIREMEKFYNISYPTVRARIDEIVSILGGQDLADSGEEEMIGSETDEIKDNDTEYVKDNETEDIKDSEKLSEDVISEGPVNGPVKSQRLEILTKLSSGEIDIIEARALLDLTNN